MQAQCNSLSALLRSVFHRLKQLVLIHRHKRGREMATWRAPQLRGRQAWGKDPKKKVGSAHVGVSLLGAFCMYAKDWTGEILIRFCNFQDMLGQLRPRGRSLSPDFRLPRFLNSDVNDFDNDDHTTCDKGLDPPPQKWNETPQELRKPTYRGVLESQV